MQRLKNILLEIEYDGTDYFGWQIQKDKITVQGKIEEAIEKLFHKKVRLFYAGRTDRGVHAKAQIANFFIQTTLSSQNIFKALNSFLPQNIRIRRVKEVSLSFFAYKASSKIYRYLILNTQKPSVFWRHYSWHIDNSLDVEKMKKIAEKLVGYKDFSIFAKEVKRYKNTFRNLKRISIRKRGSFIYIDIEADGFLRGMARGIVYFLVEVGKSKIPLKEAEAIIKKKIPYNKKLAPPSGLYLYKVKYEKE